MLALVRVSHQCLRSAQLVMGHGLGGLRSGHWCIGSWQSAVVVVGCEFVLPIGRTYLALGVGVVLGGWVFGLCFGVLFKSKEARGPIGNLACFILVHSHGGTCCVLPLLVPGLSCKKKKLQ